MDDFHMMKTVAMDATHVVCAYPTGSAAVRCCKGAEPVPETTYGCQNRKILGSCYGSKKMLVVIGMWVIFVTNGNITYFKNITAF